MTRLLIFAITMLLLSSICNGQGKSTFGATRAQDTSFTAAQVKFSAYGGSLDTMLMIILPNGDVKKVAKSAFSGNAGYGLLKTGNTIYVDTSVIVQMGGNYRPWGMIIGNTATSLELIAYNDTRFLIEDNSIKVFNVDSFLIQDGGALRAGALISDDGVKFSNYPNAGILGTDANGELIDNSDAYLPVLNIESFGADTINDATAAIQAAINYLCGVEETFNAGNVTLDSVRAPRSGVIYIPAKKYKLMRGLVKNVTHPTLGTRWVNSQLYIPLVSEFNSGRQYTQISIEGETPPNFLLNYLGAREWPLAVNEPTLHSTIDNDGSYQPAILRAVPGDTLNPFSVPIALNLTEVHLKNLTFRAHHDATTGVQLCGADLWFTAEQIVENCRFESDTDNYYTVTPTYKNYALRTAATGTGNTHYILNCLFTGGYYYGSVLYEHAYVQNGIYGVVKIPFEIGTANYKVDLDNCLIVGSPYKISTGDFVINPSNTASSLYGSLRIEDNRTSVSGKWYSSSGKTDIVDSLNTLRGNLDIEMTIDGTPSPTGLRMNGAKNLQINVPTKYMADTTVATGYSTKYLAGLGEKWISRTNYGGLTVASSSTLGEGWVIASGNRGGELTNTVAAWLGMVTGSSEASGSYFGKPKADMSYLLSNGSFSKGLAIGTLTSDSLFFGTNNIIRGYFTSAGVFQLLTSLAINTTTQDPISISNNVNGRAGIVVRNASTGNNASSSFFFDVSSAFTDYGGVIHYAPTTTGSILGLPRASATFLLDDGTTNTGLGVGTQTSDPVVIGSNNTARITIAGTGNISLHSKVAAYNNAAPTNGQLLIGHTANGTFEAATLTAGTGIDITNGAGAITIASNGNATVTTTSAGTLSPSASGHYVFTGTTSTWTLPAVSGTSGRVMFIKNRGSGTVTINTTAAANEIYSSSAVNTYALTAGSAIILVSDGSFFNVE